MTRGDVVLVRPAHPKGGRGKKRPAVVVQADAYAAVVPTVVVVEGTTNILLRSDPACLFVQAASPDGQAAGLNRDTVFTCLVLATVPVVGAPRIGALSPALMQQLDACLKAALDLR